MWLEVSWFDVLIKVFLADCCIHHHFVAVISFLIPTSKHAHCHYPIYSDRHTSDHNIHHILNMLPHISCSIEPPKDSTFDDTPSRLEFNPITELPLHPVRSHSLIPSILTKSSDPHYLPSLSLSFIVSDTPWKSEWMKPLHTAIGLAPMQDPTVRMSP
jgi:hypothetical protein